MKRVKKKKYSLFVLLFFVYSQPKALYHDENTFRISAEWEFAEHYLELHWYYWRPGGLDG